MTKKFLTVVVAAVLSLFLVSVNACALSITLDPGHGGENLGANCEYDGEIVFEKDLNLKLAFLLKDELEKYVDKQEVPVEVHLARTEDVALGLLSRVVVGKENKSEVVISLHLNATAHPIKRQGAMILVTNSKDCRAPGCSKDLYAIEAGLGEAILQGLETLGIPRAEPVDESVQPKILENGFLRRPSTDGEVYPNGEVADYYGIVKWGVVLGVPSIIVEHCYLDSEQEYRDFLATDEKLGLLAEADAKGIAAFYNLKKVC